MTLTRPKGQAGRKPDGQAALIDALRKRDDWTMDTLAAALGCTVRALDMRLRRAVAAGLVVREGDTYRVAR